MTGFLRGDSWGAAGEFRPFGNVVGTSGSISSSSRFSALMLLRDPGREAETEVATEEVRLWWPPFLKLSCFMMSLMRAN